MQPDFYVINSPSFPEKPDFERFDVWCEWHDPAEEPYLKSICTNELEFEEVIVKPYTEGFETFYPIATKNDLPFRDFLYLQVAITIAGDLELNGFIATVKDEIVGLTAWLSGTPDDGVDFYRADRLVAKDENPLSVASICQRFDIETFDKLEFRSERTLSNGTQVNGSFELNLA